MDTESELFLVFEQTRTTDENGWTHPESELFYSAWADQRH